MAETPNDANPLVCGGGMHSFSSALPLADGTVIRCKCGQQGLTWSNSSFRADGVNPFAPPAAPCVGEPEPYTDDEMALVLAELPNWLEHVETRECPVCHNRSGGFKMSCPPICTSCGWKSKVHPSMIEQAIPEIAARLSALRSSLEEARKDSERLRADVAHEKAYAHCRMWCDAMGSTLPCSCGYDRSDRFLRAPSPRDEP